MAITNAYQRQEKKYAFFSVGPANMGAGNGVEVTIPRGALVDEIAVVTAIGFNSGTTGTVTVGDGTTTFANAVDVMTAGNETVANTPKAYPNGGTITVSLAQTGAAATAGQTMIKVGYLQLGNASSVQE